MHLLTFNYHTAMFDVEISAGEFTCRSRRILLTTNPDSNMLQLLEYYCKLMNVFVTSNYANNEES